MTTNEKEETWSERLVNSVNFCANLIWRCLKKYYRFRYVVIRLTTCP